MLIRRKVHPQDVATVTAPYSVLEYYHQDHADGTSTLYKMSHWEPVPDVEPVWEDVTMEVGIGGDGRGLVHRLWCAVWTSDDYRFVKRDIGTRMEGTFRITVERRVKSPP
jgi:hypothetical protein